jgi:hypothetical protein
MFLDKWYWSNEQIKASSDEVNIEKRMMSHEAVDSFVVDHCVIRSELDHYFLVRVARDGAFYIVEEEDVIGICE